jgi:D-alanyl-D-alanine carboxypeptidase
VLAGCSVLEPSATVHPSGSPVVAQLPPPAAGSPPAAPASEPGLATPAPAPTESIPADPALAPILKGLLEEWLAETGAPGGALAVRLADGRTAVVAGGQTDDRGGDPVQPADRFRIGSITKTYVATLILQLAEEGRLDLDGRLAAYISEAPHAQRVTLRQLLGHTSGVADFGSVPAYRDRLLANPGRDWTADEVLELIVDRPLDFEPGERWAYSNTNYILLGLVAEAVGGSSLAELLRTRMLGPLKLTDTYLEGIEEAPRMRVSGHFDLDGDGQSDNVRLIPYTALVTSGAAAGGLSASPLDVLDFADALMAGRLVGRGSLGRMMEASAESEAAGGYGLGLMRFRHAGRSAWGHAGGLPGFAAILAHAPADGVTVVVLANDSGVDVGTLLERVAEQVAGLAGGADGGPGSS